MSSSKHDKTMTVQHEEEGLYHRREYERTKPVTTYEKYQVPSATTRSSSKQLSHRHDNNYTSDDDNDNFEEWTTSKRKVNHKTRQVETRVSRQLLVEDGRVIADSGPQVTTRIKEDNKVEECEKEKQPKNRAKFEALENAPEGESSGRVLGEKKEIQRVSREVREENMQYHDERFKELTGHDVHRRAIQAPHELITINDDKHHGESSAPRGKMVHYSNKGKKYQDTDEILEVAKLAIDGSITKEVKRTRHHEEFSEDEKPDELGEAEALRHEPIVTRSSRRHVDYVNDFDDTATPSCSSDDEVEAEATGHHLASSRDHQRAKSGKAHKLHHKSSSSSTGRTRHHHHHHHQHHDEAFPRYEIDPLLNSLRDEDFKPTTTTTSSLRSPATIGRHHQQVREHSLERKNRHDESSSDDDRAVDRHRGSHRQHHQHRHQLQSSPTRSVSPATAGRMMNSASRGGPGADHGPVEIPEEYRANRQRLLSGKGQRATGGQQQRERSFSPAQQSKLSSRSHHRAHHHPHHKEDASVQARLTDEEVERRSVSSSASSSVVTHEKTARHLQRQSTANSSRNYYYGDRKHQRNQTRPNKGSLSSASSLSSLSDPKERTRKQGTRSRDSGFKSPHYHKSRHGGGEVTPIEATTHGASPTQPQQIYSVSSKSARKNRQQQHQHQPDQAYRVSSPTPTAASQRSVKTTTTTMSAGLADRPLSANRQQATRSTTPATNKKRTTSSDGKNTAINGRDHNEEANEQSATDNKRDEQHHEQHRQSQFDTVSLSSLQGPNATTIKVPYRRTTIEVERPATNSHHYHHEQDENETNKTNINNGRKSTREGMVSGSTTSEMSFQEDIQSLSRRLESIRRQSLEPNNNKQQFDYKTIIKNIQPASQQVIPKQNQVIDAYNVRVIEHNSPFRQTPIVGCGGGGVAGSSSTLIDDNQFRENNYSNNSIQQQGNQVLINVNETNNTVFNLGDYIKYRAVPVLVDSGIGGDSTSSNMDLDRMSLASSCSLQSSKTYKIRTINNNFNQPTQLSFVRDDNQVTTQQDEEIPLTDRVEHQSEANNEGPQDTSCNQIEFDENGNSKRPQAWVFDPRDGSSTAIAPPVRPKRPETPQVDAKTEELVQARGGRSYYLELVEPRSKRPQRPSSIDSLYSRWNSHGALSNNLADHSSRHNSRQAIASSKASNLDLNNSSVQKPTNNNFKPFTFKKLPPSKTANSNNNNNNPVARRQLPFGGPAPNIGSKSRSSSCLLTVTKPSKYSIYGGYRKPGENNKPVPRLSYSRAIGPKSQRQIDAQPKVPSRYLKMK